MLTPVTLRENNSPNIPFNMEKEENNHDETAWHTFLNVDYSYCYGQKDGIAE